MQYLRMFIRAGLAAAIAGFLLVCLVPANAALYSPRQALSQQTI